MGRIAVAHSLALVLTLSVAVHGMQRIGTPQHAATAAAGRIPAAHGATKIGGDPAASQAVSSGDSLDSTAARTSASRPVSFPLALLDRFGRDCAGRDIELVDWDGHIANPALRLNLRVTTATRLPLRVRLSADSPRLMFNLFSEVSAQGPRKTLFIERADAPVEFCLAVFPDRDGADDEAWLRIEATNPYGASIASVHRIRVHDEDRGEPGTFRIAFDFSHDETGFFDLPAARQVFEQAANDWAYFFEGEPGTIVAAGTEVAWMWAPDGFRTGREIRNTIAFGDYLLYAHGMQHPDMRSGATASDRLLSGFQAVEGVVSGLRRSGTVSIETRGNWHPDGWHFSTRDDEWLISRNGWGEPTDFYSVAHHEIGHALLYHESIPAFAARVRDGRFDSDELRAYLGAEARISEVEHFEGLIDPPSRVGAFGNEYGGEFPLYRWLITKTDLLVAQACGYRLRDTSPFRPLTVEAKQLWRFRPVAAAPIPVAGAEAPALATSRSEPVNQAAAFDLGVRGGIPPYFVRLASGELPAGFELDSYHGELRATDPRPGTYELTFEVRDQDPREPVVTGTLRIEVVP